VIVELQRQLLAQERELDNREGVVNAWEVGLMNFAHALEELRAEHDASRACMDDIWQNFPTQVCASSSRSSQLTDLGRMMEECQTLPYQREIDLEVWEVILAEELERACILPVGRTCRRS
jgi:hypothetical protein